MFEMIILCFISFILSSHSAVTNNISMPICPESFSCSGLGTFKYPFYNTTDSRCGLIKVTCTSEGGEVQIGRRSYDIVGKLDSDYNPNNLIIWNRTFEQLVNNTSCEALMDNLTIASTSPLLYSVSVIPNITLFKCTKNLTSAQQTNAYFNPHNYNRYNRCRDYNFYYNYLNGTVPSDLPHTCQVLQLPAMSQVSPGLDETNIFSLLSTVTSIYFRLSHSCSECQKTRRLCGIENGHVQCLDAKKGIPDSYREQTRTPNREKEGRERPIKIMVIGGSLAVAALGGSIAIYFVMILCIKRINGRKINIKDNVNVELFLKNHELLSRKRYSYSEVEKMTNSFSVKLGQGGFGVVYKGVLRNQSLVAVKVLSEVKGDGQDFINEVASVSRTSHVNIVSLMGFCWDGGHRALIYEFMPNGSLERFIYSNGSSGSSQLGWEKLHQIAIGIARGLEYLYRGCSTRILHFDIKPHNILLDDEFCPKISDFGLAKLFREKESRISMSHMRGTPGYIAPELFSRNFGEVSHKSDVYSYGMMILEMVGGRKNIEVGVDHTSEIYFPHWIYKKVELHEEQLGLHDIVSDQEDRTARKMIIVGLWCIQTNPSSRPTITKVLEMLEGDLASLEIPPKPYLSSPSRCVGSPSTDSLFPYCPST